MGYMPVFANHIIVMLTALLMLAGPSAAVYAAGTEPAFAPEGAVVCPDSLPAAEEIITVAETVMTDTVMPVAEDSVAKERREGFRATYLIAPGALIAVGTFATYNGWCRKVSRSVRDGMTDIRKDHYLHFDDYVQYVPAVVYLGLGFTGIKAKHTFLQRLAVGATSYISMAALTNILKYSIREKRPDSNARNSFPSGHTATAFTGAELIREEYGNAWGAGAYVVATGIAFMRLYNGRHWLNDVIAGAGIGILSARIGYWMLPLYRRWLKLDSRDGIAFAAVPAFEPGTRSLGVALCATF